MDVSPASSDQLDVFFEPLKQIVRIAREAQAHIDEQLATSLCVTELMQPNEMQLSRLLACLLDPAGQHGQDDRFLRAFLSRIGIDLHWSEPIKVRREYQTYVGRFDILIHNGPIGLGIENKPWAGESDDQMEEYAKYLARRYQRWMLVYLSGSGKPPSSMKEERQAELKRTNQLCVVPYLGEGSLAEWIAKCIGLCKAERTRWFLHDLLMYLKSRPEFASGEADD